MKSFRFGSFRFLGFGFVSFSFGHGLEEASRWQDPIGASGSLTVLRLYGNNIGDEGAKALAAGISASGSLALKTLWAGQLRDHAELVAACKSKGVELK